MGLFGTELMINRRFYVILYVILYYVYVFQQHWLRVHLYLFVFQKKKELGPAQLQLVSINYPFLQVKWECLKKNEVQYTTWSNFKFEQPGAELC